MKRFIRSAAMLVISVMLCSMPFYGTNTVYATKSKITEEKKTYLSSESIIIKEGESSQIEFIGALETPAYMSTKPWIARIDENGVIDGISPGVAYITAYDGTNLLQCRVTVYEVRLSSDMKEYDVTGEQEIYITLKDRKNTENLKITSSDNSIASAEVIGFKDDVCTIVVKQKKEGTVKLTIKRTKSVEPFSIIINAKEEKEDLTPVEIYALCSKSMVEFKSKQSDNNQTAIGSGFFIGNGIVVTNYHVISGASEIVIEDYEGNSYPVKGYYIADEKKDVAILEVSGSRPPLEMIYNYNAKAGEIVYTIGSPYGYTGTFSMGVISNISRVVEDIECYQMTAPISRGNSGGPLINSRGQVIGINTFTRLDGQNLNFSLKLSEIPEYDKSTYIDINEFYNQ